jgi:large conductance mechanosensitive channel
MRILQEFREFAIKGNAVDLAVGVIIGVAFGRIVNSIVEDLIMPPIGYIVGNLDFSNLYLSLSDKVDPSAGLSLADARKLGPVFAYGNFITVLINFVIVAFCIFLLVKVINQLKRREEVAPTVVPEEILLLRDIRDQLKHR